MTKTSLTSAIAIGAVLFSYNASALWWGSQPESNGGVDEDAKSQLRSALLQKKSQLDPQQQYEAMGGDELMTQSIMIKKEYQDALAQIMNSKNTSELKSAKINAQRILIQHALDKQKAKEVAEKLEEDKKLKETLALTTPKSETQPAPAKSWFWWGSSAKAPAQPEVKAEEAKAAPATEVKAEEKAEAPVADTTSTNVQEKYDIQPAASVPAAEQPKVEQTAGSSWFYQRWFSSKLSAPATDKAEKAAESTNANPPIEMKEGGEKEIAKLEHGISTELKLDQAELQATEPAEETALQTNPLQLVTFEENPSQPNFANFDKAFDPNNNNNVDQTPHSNDDSQKKNLGHQSPSLTTTTEDQTWPTLEEAKTPKKKGPNQKQRKNKRKKR